MKKMRWALVAAGLLGGSMAANAVPIDTSPITSDYYIEFDGLLWAWASPVSSEIFGNNTLYAPEIQDGWRMASADEWSSRPVASDFGTSVDFKCASRFWNSVYSHCDYGDAVNGFVTSGNIAGGVDSSDTWYVRSVSVPEPGTLALFGLGIVGFGLMRRRRST